MNDTAEFDPQSFDIPWERVQRGCEDLCYTTNMLETRPKVVITKQEDAIVGSIVANMLDIPFAVAHMNPNKGNGVILKCAPVVSAPIRSGEFSQDYPPILMVSSLIDDGRNIDDLITSYKMIGHEVVVASLLYKRRESNPPDFYNKLVHSSVYCKFPWK